MGPIIVVLSGPIGAGKSTLAGEFERRYGALRVNSRELLRKRAGTEGMDRQPLQAAGEALDQSTGGRWLAEGVQEALRHPAVRPELVVVDAARISRQIDDLRRIPGARVVHVHLRAAEEALAARYQHRRAQAPADTERASFEQARAHPVEQGVESLSSVAELVLDTAQLSPEAVLVQAACQAGLYGRGTERLVDVLVGGQYGSEGKGHIVSHLAPEYGVLVRVGGPNAGHRVYEEPTPYTFHLLPAGTRRAPEARLVLGPGMVLSLEVLLREVAECQVSPERLSIDPNALLVEAQDVAFERGSLKQQLGSTAQGVGAATARKVLRTAAEPPVRLAREAEALKPFLRPTAEVLDSAFARGQRVLLEGTQGVGLSLHHGDYPYVTSRDTTASGCLAEAGIAPGRVRKTVLVCRTYPIRVQNPEGASSGPLEQEISWEEVSRRSGLPLEPILKTELTSTTGRQRRVGEFDWVLLRKAASLNAPTDVALTFVDYLSAENWAARRFEQLTGEAHRYIENIERVAGAPVSLLSTGFQFRSIIDRRSW
jgi:adenylosuccinate synthase